MSNTDRMPGTVARIKTDKGFFFIKAADGDYFAHHSSLPDGDSIDRLTEGDRVIFTPTTTPKGLRAEAVVREGR